MDIEVTKQFTDGFRTWAIDLGQMKPPTMPEAIPCTVNIPSKAEKRTKKMSRYYDEDLDMYVDTNKTDTQRSQDYFLKRIGVIECNKDYDLRKQFGFIDDDRPANFEEFMARIQAGKFTWRDEKKGPASSYWQDYIRWRDPAVEEDEKGLGAARKAFYEESAKARDTVMALPADKAMEAVQALASWTTK